MGYLEYNAQLDGLNDVSATCLIDVSASYFNSLFSFEFDVSNISDICSNTLKLKVNNGNYFQNISFSQSNVKSGNANNDYIDQRLFKDVIRKISKQIIGGYASVDVLTNENNMLNAVYGLDVSLCNSYNEKVNNFTSIGYKTKTQYMDLSNNEAKSFYSMGHSLLSVILDNSAADLTSYNNLSTLMTNSYTNNSNSLPIEVNVPFCVGNYLCVRLTYRPENGNNYQFIPLTYKCLLRLV